MSYVYNYTIGEFVLSCDIRNPIDMCPRPYRETFRSYIREGLSPDEVMQKIRSIIYRGANVH